MKKSDQWAGIVSSKTAKQEQGRERKQKKTHHIAQQG